jgi:hypothetical protein
MTALTQLADEMSSDESARAGNENEIVFFHQTPEFHLLTAAPTTAPCPR